VGIAGLVCLRVGEDRSNNSGGDEEKESGFRQ